MEWPEFVDRVHRELVKGRLFSDYRYDCENEQALTSAITCGLRDLVSSTFRLPGDSDDLFDIVTCRSGDTQRDKKAYTGAKADRWVFFHEVFFAPDILIRKEPGNPDRILPIEVKLLTAKSPSQSIATAIGQALIYVTRYPQSIVFLGVLRSAKWGKYKVRIRANRLEQEFYDSLRLRGVRVIMREVGL